MHRSSTFSVQRWPSAEIPTIWRVRTFGPIGLLNPTTANFIHQTIGDLAEKLPESELESNQDGEKGQKDQPADAVEYQWTSRNNRKGRHLLKYVPAQDPATAKYLVPPSTSSLKEILKIVLRMFTYYPVWDVSWLVAYIFTLGSIVWVINGFFAWLPLVRPSTEFSTEALYGGGITAFIGATIFEFGSILLMFEAVNENRSGCFGWAIHQLIEDNFPGQEPKLRLTPALDSCQHHHQNRKNLVGKSAPKHRDAEDPNQDAEEENRSNSSPDGKVWIWIPSWSELFSHYFHELGFLACCFQLAGASVFWISGFTALPGILNHLSQPAENGVFWSPQVIGGLGFVVSGVLFMLETQEKWYRPALGVLGWHIGIWNLIGGAGFTLCPIFGYNTASWSQYEASLSTFWGSWAFLVGSLIQLYESLQKNPVEVEKGKRKKMQS